MYDNLVRSIVHVVSYTVEAPLFGPLVGVLIILIPLIGLPIIHNQGVRK